MTKSSLRAVIREADCIGCGKCIPPCPVDAILGSQKQMHTVITDECIGCKLCVAPCPVDCIDMIILTKDTHTDLDSTSQKAHHINRYRARKVRLQQSAVTQDIHSDKKAYIQAAILRRKTKKSI